MGHFGLEEWVDFARGVGPEKRRIAMRQHLESGCADCGSAVRTWQRVYLMCRADSSYEPPSSVLRIVKGHFAIHRPEVRSRVPIIARLLFDGFGGSLMAGVRSGEALERHLLYQAGSYEIDLQIESHGYGDAVQIVGQVLSSIETAHPLDRTPVTLVADKQIITQSVTNSIGEFNLKSNVKGPFELRFEIPKGTDFCVLVAHAGSARFSSLSDATGTGRNNGARKKRQPRRPH